MKKFHFLTIALIGIFSFQLAEAQLCTSDRKGPNLLGARGTFSTPFITVNENADACLSANTQTYNPLENIGNKLEGCATSEDNISPCSDYVYTDKANGMVPEYRYTIIKTVGDATGYNCIHPTSLWKASDHTGDGGYFMAVNGAPNTSSSKIFYQIKNIPVCAGTSYEFSAWVINMMPNGTQEAAPNVSFVVNGTTIATSGPIPYDGKWHQVGGMYTPPAGTFEVNLQVVNATQVAAGNDLGLDDISFRVCQSSVDVADPVYVQENQPATAKYVVFDPVKQNTFYRVLFSTDGGVTFNQASQVMQGTYEEDGSFAVNYEIFGGSGVVREMHNMVFRLVVSTSQEGLDNPDCIYFNDYILLVDTSSGGPVPVTLTSFTGSYSNGVANLKWQTSQESNSDYFEVYRSYDGKSFEQAGKEKAAGNSNMTVNYQHQDHVNASNGQYVFYKLKQVDKDGKFAFSEVIKLSMGDVATSFKIFPNPAVNDFTVSFTSVKASNAVLMVRNTSGQTVLSEKINVLKGSNSIQVSSSQLKSGMYYLTIVGDEINYTGKLQKK